MPCAEDAQPKAEELPAAPAPVPAPICKPDLEPTTVTKEEGSRDLLGSRVRVYWPAEDAWFKGTLSKYSSDTKKHYVRYDDGDSEWVDLTTEKYEILPGEAAAPKKKASTHKSKAKGGSKAASRKRPAAAVISSDSEGDEDGDGAAPSGSEYEASDASSSDAESLVSENDSEEDVSDEEDSEDEKPARKAKKAAPAAKPSKAKAPATTPAVVNPAGKAPNSSHRTPGVALNNGVSITPDSGNGVGAGGVTPAVPRPSAAHAPASATAMRTALDDAASPSDALNAAATANDASRFMGRDAARFPFIQPDKIRDAGRRRPDEPGWVPPSTVNTTFTFMRISNASEHPFFP